MRQLETDMAVVQQRLDSGNKAFASIQSSMEKLNQRITELSPKPPGAMRLIGVTLAIVMAFGGAVWTLSVLLGERPTKAEIKEELHDHETSDGHPTVSTQLNTLQENQVAGATELRLFRERTEKDLQEIKTDLKSLTKKR